ncbi:MAG: sulfatase-like hydrolase/transferase [Planctomycetota bacterium]
MATKPNVLFLMTDQQRFDTIAALGNGLIHAPNMDRLVRRGVAFTNAYSTCPVCVPARYTLHTGREPLTTGVFTNGCVNPPATWAATMEERCGPFLARRMGLLGCRTFGIGKFHAEPWDQDLGFEVQMHSEELYVDARQRAGDAFARFIRDKHPEYDWVDMLQGERTEMYYVPQMSPLPTALTVESWAADLAVEQLMAADGRPFFGFVSFIGPHPPCAPPQPYNRMYNPDRMPNPVRGDLAVDHADDNIPWVNHAVWAEDISEGWARVIKARYYGEISYIDACLGRILDAVESRPDAANTVICFFADHGDMLGDHHGWQKDAFFEASCRVPFMVSWPARLPANVRSAELACLTDLFGVATTAAGASELRDGTDLLGMLAGKAEPRRILFGCFGRPGTRQFKIMTRSGEWKHIFIANGGREQLFNVERDPQERQELSAREPAVLAGLRSAAEQRPRNPIGESALEGSGLRRFEFEMRPRRRILQFDLARGVTGFPERPADVLGEKRAHG